ncbi:hypothetical protein PV08_00978 [Exophiala spinifera]|uniref:Uncharacterized protein n=1 Tax=Exophiala spinifera TaxID=91928 RepID=A0A0D2BN85_9EURO|nr:uncharacterized protein PV08_00978 [Exophiala spinifera]KIW20403.1 hypothetical protein PV08_00978 [Exophiala spinifera]
MSPSQPLHWQAPTCNNRATVPGFEPAIGFSSPIYPVMGRPDEEISQQTPTRHRHGEGLTNSQPLDRARQPRHRQSFPSQLSDQIHGPNPQGGHARFVTHVTKTLRKLAVRVPLSKHFYPYCVTRDVRVLERGYWEFLVGIIESPTTPDPRQAQQKRRNDEPISLCSGRDFLQLWRNVSRFIKDGKAGWGTSIVRKQVRRGLWRIRLFTWAEILGHIWLVLWVLSDKLIENIPMHWIDGRGTAVVTMSGRKQRRNGRYIWAPKSTEGERGCWGMRKLEMV